MLMKKAIHPQFQVTTYTCASCKNAFQAGSTSADPVTIEVCSNCHPFYTGEAGIIVDTFSRVDQFQKFEAKKDEGKASNKKKKRAAKAIKTREIKLDKPLTLADMLKQNK
jgi:large subunit ribosomal protein L31